MSRRLLTGATVWAGPECQPRRGWLLVAGDRLEALGDSERQRPPADEVVDLAGCHVLPGFVDVHLHLTQAAWFGHGHDGSRWQSLAEALRAVSAAASAEPASGPGPGWLLFWGAERWRWPEGRLPTAAELDQAAPGRRVLVSTADMHRGAASAAALAALGLDGPRGYRAFGEDVTRDRRGQPTGELWEAVYAVALQAALSALADVPSPASGDGAVQAVLAAEARRYLQLGITHAHDPYVPPGWHEQMIALQAATALRLSWATGSPDGMHCRPTGPDQAPAGSYGQASREVKLFADGGDRCALRLPTRAVAGLAGGAIGESIRLRALGPLREATRRKLVIGPRGLRTPYLHYTDAELASLAAAYLEAGIRLRIHALGNLAGEQAARILRQVGAPPGTAVIDHLLACDPATADRVASTGAPVSYQPGFLTRYGDMLHRMRIGRYAAVLGGRLLLQAGIPLAISSDHPCGEADPLHNLRCAVRHTLQPGQTLTRAEAVRAYTVTAAASLGAPGAGGLAPGQAADLVICDGDPFAEGTRVTQTWVAGQVAWPPGANRTS